MNNGSNCAVIAQLLPFIFCYPDVAEWYRDMANAHLSFNNRAHEMIIDLIDKYNRSDEHANHPEYAAGMMAVWQDLHNDLVADNARVRAIVDSF